MGLAPRKETLDLITILIALYATGLLWQLHGLYKYRSLVVGPLSAMPADKVVPIALMLTMLTTVALIVWPITVIGVRLFGISKDIDFDS